MSAAAFKPGGTIAWTAPHGATTGTINVFWGPDARDGLYRVSASEPTPRGPRLVLLASPGPAALASQNREVRS